MNVYQLEDGETHWYVAKSEDDALRLHLQCLFIEPLPEDLMTISDKVEKELGMRVEEMEVSQRNPNQFKWLAECQGEGYLLCSTVY